MDIPTTNEGDPDGQTQLTQPETVGPDQLDTNHDRHHGPLEGHEANPAPVIVVGESPVPANRHPAGGDPRPDADPKEVGILATGIPDPRVNPLEYHDMVQRAAPHTYAQYVTKDPATGISAWVAARHLAYIGRRIAQAVAKGNARIIVNMPARHGKALAHETPILTTAGWKNHGDLRPGDFVFGLDGTPKRVEAIGEDCEATLSVEISNGGKSSCSIKTHPNHEWLIWSRSGCPAWQSSKIEKSLWQITRSSAWLAGRSGHKTRNLRAGSKIPRNTYQLPPIKPLQMPYQELPIHPYFMGVWLGDGCSTSPSFCFSEKDRVILDEIKNLGYIPSWDTVHKDTKVNYVGFTGLIQILGSLGVKGRKHIPTQYKYASIDQRMQLLAGIIDTDGSVDKHQRIRIVTVSDLLRDDIMELIRSLGYTVTSNTQDACMSSSGIQGNAPTHYISFTADRPIPTRVPRKRIMERQKASYRKKGFVSCLPCDPVPARCIQVEGGIYLAGKELIPTHNSELISHWTPLWFLDLFPHKKVMVTSYDSSLAENWGRACRDSAESLPLVRVNLKEDNKSVSQWNTKEGGGMKCGGIGTGTIGWGFHLGLVDDPCKDYANAVSPAMQKAFKEWWEFVFMTRREPGASIVVLGHRLASSDPCGYLMMEDASKWEVIKMPAIAVPGDLLGRKPGEALWPERWPVEGMAEMQKSIAWQSMYQQDPKSELGDRVYDHFTQDANVVPNAHMPEPVLRKGPEEIIALCLDFNINPGMHAGVGQLDAQRDEIYMDTEFHGERWRTEHVMKEFIAWCQGHGHKGQGTFPWKYVDIYGDRSGRNASTVTSETDYGLIQKMLTAAEIPYRIRVPFKNPPVNDRVITVNEALRDMGGTPHLFINKRCKRLLVDMNSQPRDENGQPDKTDQSLGHAGDFVGYYLYWVRPIRRQQFKPAKTAY